MKILVLGGDGFCGWPTSLHLSAQGHDVTIVDSLVRRDIDAELGVDSLTPIRPIEDRLATWRAKTGRDITFRRIDVAKDYDALLELLVRSRPDAVVHFAEQRAAPYSMKSPRHKRYTVENNVLGTHNLACALVEAPSLVLASVPGGPDVTDPLTLRFHTESGEVQRVCFPDGKASPRVWSTGPVRILYTGSLWTSQWGDLAA